MGLLHASVAGGTSGKAEGTVSVTSTALKSNGVDFVWYPLQVIVRADYLWFGKNKWYWDVMQERKGRVEGFTICEF